MKQIKVLTYILDFALSNKYLKIIINCLGHKILNEKCDFLFVFVFKNKTSTFLSLNLSYKHCMIQIFILKTQIQTLSKYLYLPYILFGSSIN